MASTSSAKNNAARTSLNFCFFDSLMLLKYLPAKKRQVFLPFFS